MEYVNQLKKYTRPDLVEDDRRCGLCGARHIDTQEHVAKLMESDSYLSNIGTDVPQTPVGKEINSFPPSHNYDKVRNMTDGMKPDSKVTQSVIEHASLQNPEDLENGHSLGTAQASTASETIMNLLSGLPRESFSSSMHTSSDDKMRKTSPGCERRSECSDCHKVVKRASSLKKHMRVHTGERPFSCPKCNNAFTQLSALVAHIETHPVELRYPCTKCNETFKRQGNLTRHIMIHTGERPYSCTECDKAFSRQDSLANHTKAHAGERPYSCTTCDKSFRYKSTLVNHIRTHTGERPYKCDGCDMAFTQASNRERHVKRRHPGQ